jgi:hypothetical protein
MKTYSIRDIEKEMPLTEGWIRKMEKDGHLQLESPKVRGQVRRLFNQGDVVNVLRLASLRTIGFGPKKLNWYKSMVTRIRNRIYPFLKKSSKDPVDQFFVFHARDIFPNGDPKLVDWKELDNEEYCDVFEHIAALYSEALWLNGVAKNTRKSLETIEKQLDIFMDEIEGALCDTVSGVSLLTMKSFRKTRKK